MACLADAGIVLDLDTHSLRGIDLALFQCNKLQRDRSHYVYLPEDYPFTIKMTSHEAITEFPQSRLMGKFVSGPVFAHPSRRNAAQDVLGTARHDVGAQFLPHKKNSIGRNLHHFL